MALFDIDANGNVLLPVYVQPGAHAASLAGRYGDTIKVRVAAQAEKGRANAAVTRLLADELGVRTGDVDVVRGRTSRRKRVLLRGVEAATVESWLASHGIS